MLITNEDINYYENKANYFRNVGFTILADDFQKIANMLKAIKAERDSV